MIATDYLNDADGEAVNIALGALLRDDYSARVMARAIKIRIEQVRAEIEANPIVKHDGDASEDIRYKLGMIEGLKWPEQLISAARVAVKNNPNAG